MPTNQIKRVVIALCAVMMMSINARAESPELMNLIKTMPKDSVVYAVFNFTELTNIAPIWETDSNGKRTLTEDIRYEMEKSISDQSEFDQFLFNKMESGGIRWVVVGLQNAPVMGAELDGTDINIRVYGDFTYEELKAVAATENVQIPPMGDVGELKDGMYMSVFADHYVGFSMDPSSLTISHDEPLSKAARHMSPILPVAPPLTIAVSLQEFLKNAQPGTLPPNLNEIPAVSLTLNKLGKNSFSIDAMIQYDNATALETGFGMINGYRQMAPMFLEQAKQQLAQAPNQSSADIKNQKSGIAFLDMILSEAKVSKVAPNVVIRIPINAETLKKHGITEMFEEEFATGFLRARDTSRLNACQENQTKLDGAVQQYILEENKADLAACVELHTNDVADPKLQGVIFGPTAYIRKVVECPAGGKYSILRSDGRNGEASRCSLPDHPYPTGYY